MKKKGITYPKGFTCATAKIGPRDRDDLTLVVSNTLAVSTLVTTTNQVKAAPVIWDKEVFNKTPLKKAVLINVGSANAATGDKGLNDTREEAIVLAKSLGVEEDKIYVCSTGVIGIPIELKEIKEKIPTLVKELTKGDKINDLASKAIFTTDTKPKLASLKIKIGGKTVKIAGMAKGAGMIRPNMATMLCFITTDCKIDPGVLNQMQQQIIKDTFNMISVDGDMSTNDTCIVLANGEAKNKEINSLTSKDGKIFYKALKKIEKSLAKQIAFDGEGASKNLTVKVKGAKDDNEARILAKSVIESSLVKTAIFGADANWGRIICSLGYADAKIDPENLTISVKSPKGKMTLYKDQPVNFSEEEAKKILNEKEITILIKLNLGNGKATAWGCDLTYEYVKINGEYRS